jgi:hypothetical protein
MCATLQADVTGRGQEGTPREYRSVDDMDRWSRGPLHDAVGSALRTRKRANMLESPRRPTTTRWRPASRRRGPAGVVRVLYFEARRRVLAGEDPEAVVAVLDTEVRAALAA